MSGITATVLVRGAVKERAARYRAFCVSLQEEGIAHERCGDTEHGTSAGQDRCLG